MTQRAVLRLVLAVLVAVVTLVPFEGLTALDHESSGCCEGKCFCRLLGSEQRHCEGVGAGSACLLDGPRTPGDRPADERAVSLATRLAVLSGFESLTAPAFEDRLAPLALARPPDPALESPTPPPRRLSAA